VWGARSKPNSWPTNKQPEPGKEDAHVPRDPAAVLAPTKENVAVAADQAVAPTGIDLPGVETEPPGTVADPLPSLVTGAMRGDTDATRALLVNVGKQVRGACRTILGPAHPDLEDTVQECFVGLIRALPAYRFEGTFSHYALRIAVRTALAARRHHRAHRAREDLAESFDADLPGEGASPSELMLATERRSALRRLVDDLPEAQAQALLMRIVFDLSIEEIAKSSAVSVNTVKTRLRLAKDALRRRICQDSKLSSLLGGRR
jgi:RNA polymerase sigma factor (sigma-70 family)